MLHTALHDQGVWLRLAGVRGLRVLMSNNRDPFLLIVTRVLEESLHSATWQISTHTVYCGGLSTVDYKDFKNPDIRGLRD